MVVSCVAVDCSNSRKNSPELSFHRIPMLNDENRELRERWIANVKRHGTLPKESNFFLCSNHFEKSCFERDLKVYNISFHIIPNTVLLYVYY